MNCKKCGRKIYSKETCSCGEKAPNLHGKGVAVNTIICTVILVLSVVSLILSVSLRNIVNKNLIVNTIENVNLCDLEVENDFGQKVKLDQYIYEEFIDDNRITVQNVDNILNNPFIKNFIIEKVEGYQKFFLDEGEMEYITSDDIVSLIEENSDLLYNEAGLNFLEPDKAELRESLSDLDEFSSFCRNYLTGWFTSGYVQTYFSLAFVNFLEVLLIIVLIQWLVVYRLNGRRVFKALKKYSISVIVPSAIFFLATIPTIFLDKNSIVYSLTHDIKKPFMLSSGIILAAGIVMLIVSIIFSGKRKDNTISVLNTVSGTENIKNEQKQNESETSKVSELNYSAFAPDNSNTIVKNTEVKADNSTFAPNAVSTEKADTDKLEKTINSENKKVFCTKCGHENRVNSSFCAKCGEKLRINK